MDKTAIVHRTKQGQLTQDSIVNIEEFYFEFLQNNPDDVLTQDYQTIHDSLASYFLEQHYFFGVYLNPNTNEISVVYSPNSFDISERVNDQFGYLIQTDNVIKFLLAEFTTIDKVQQYAMISQYNETSILYKTNDMPKQEKELKRLLLNSLNEHYSGWYEEVLNQYQA